MHELSIASNIVESVSREMAERGLSRVAAIGLRIGRLTDVDANALAFGFEVITRHTPLDGTQLQIEHVATVGQCKKCGQEFEVVEFLFVCPSCGSGAVDMIRGMELEIAYVEVDETISSPRGNP